MTKRAAPLKWRRIAKIYCLAVALCAGAYTASILAVGNEPQIIASLPADTTTSIPYTSELSPTPKEIVSTSICAVVADPQAHLDKVLVFDAAVGSDCRHFTLLVDDTCDRGISFNLMDSVAKRDFQQIDRSLCTDIRGKSRDAINGRFTAVLRRESRADGLFPYQFDVHSISEITITKNPQR